MDRPGGTRCSSAARLEVDALLVTRLPNVRYLTGFTGSSSCLLLGPAGAVFLTDGRYGEQSRHEVPDLLRVASTESLLGPMREHAERLGVERLGFEKHAVTVAQLERWQDALDGVAQRGGRGDRRQRWTKDEDELALLRSAQESTDRAFEDVWTPSSSGSPSARPRPGSSSR